MNSDVNVSPQQRRYRFYVGKGIPDPWGSSKYVHHIYSYPIASEEISRLWRNKTQNCVRDYLFECPDKSVTKSRCCSCRDTQKKNQVSDELREKCTREELLGNCKSKKKLHRRRNQHPKRGPGGDVSSPNCSSDTEEEKSGNKFVGFCEYCEKHIVCKCSASETRPESDDHKSNKKFFNFCNKKGKVLDEKKICFCPYMTCFNGMRNFSQIGHHELCLSKTKTPISKEIQTDNLIKCSKTVQTDKSKLQPQPKCTCFSKCCCNKFWMKRGCSEMNSCSNFCCCINSSQNLAFPCCSFSNHCSTQKSCTCHTNKMEKHHTKKQHNKKEYEEAKTKQEISKADVEYFTLKNKVRDDMEKYEPTESHNLKNGENVFNIQNSSKTFHHLKYLSSCRLKDHPQQVEISPSLNAINFYKRNPMLLNLKQNRNLSEGLKSSYCHPENFEPSFNGNKTNFSLYTLGNRKFNHLNEATTPSMSKIKNFMNNESVTQNKSTQSGNSCLPRREKISRIMRKPKKLRIKRQEKNLLLVGKSGCFKKNLEE